MFLCNRRHDVFEQEADHLFFHIMELLQLMETIKTNQEKMMSQIDDLTSAVSAEDTVIDSAITLLNGLSSQLAAAGTDPAKLQALQTDIQNKTQALAQAVAANTPAAPSTTPAPAAPASGTPTA